MRISVSSLLKIDPASTMGILLDATFAGIDDGQALATTKALMDQFHAHGNDDGLLVLVQLGASLLFKPDCANKELLAFLRETYFSLTPDRGSFIKTRPYLVQRIGSFWDYWRDELTEGAFSFLCAVYDPTFRRHEKRMFSQDEEKARGWTPHREELLAIDSLVREKLGDPGFTPQVIEYWLKDRPGSSAVPDNLAKVLGINWIRNGGNIRDLLRLRRAIGPNIPHWSYPVLDDVGKCLRKTEVLGKDLIDRSDIVSFSKCYMLGKTWGHKGTVRIRFLTLDRLVISIVRDETLSEEEEVRFIEKAKGIFAEAFRRIGSPKIWIGVSIGVKATTNNPHGGSLGKFEVGN